jgi:hypothetical protein
MPESAQFKDQYAATLPVAPRIFKTGEKIRMQDMPPAAGAWEKRPGFLGSYECEPTGIPDDMEGRVVFKFQLLRGGGGHIQARFGGKMIPEDYKFLVEWHFRGNEEIDERP